VRQPACCRGSGATPGRRGLDTTRARPSEPLPRLSGAALSGPSRLRLVAVRAYGGAFILDVDHATTRTVGGLGLGRRTSPSGPLAAGLWAVPGGVLAAVERDPGRRLRGADHVLRDRPERPLATARPDRDAARRQCRTRSPRGGRLEPCLAARGPVHAAARARRAARRDGPLRRPPRRDERRRVDRQRAPRGDRGSAQRPHRRGDRASAARCRRRSLDAALPDPRHAGAREPGAPERRAQRRTPGHLRLVDLASGARRALAWPSWFGDIVRVVVEPRGPLVAVDFGSPAYPGPAQAEDIWILNTATGRFTHLPGYPAQVAIKFPSVVWTGDDRLVIVAQGGGRTVVGVWRRGRTTLPLHVVPSRYGYPELAPLGVAAVPVDRRRSEARGLAAACRRRQLSLPGRGSRTGARAGAAAGSPIS
jgi:hypothetical protein